ncbi:hypothetical protein [Polaribacter sp.]|uniref:hypothetical protein n=1 Tax=Polaribacter sp. TaxID=1920175 RepID=UPI003EF295A3
MGGIVYVLSLLLIHKKTKKKVLKRSFVFISLYLFSTFLILPYVAPFFGREKIQDSPFLKAHSFFYTVANRNYVQPELQKALKQISTEFAKQHPGITLVYLDANFPFINNFPLLPHISHNDGKKIDVSLIYENSNGEITNKKPSVSGYGVFTEATKKEYNQSEVCKNRGNWQYDFTKYITLGSNKNLRFSKSATRDLVNSILKQKSIGKLFIEPHLKTRMNIQHQKVRFHGCKAVRHDDHIHFQLK